MLLLYHYISLLPKFALRIEHLKIETPTPIYMTGKLNDLNHPLQ